MRRRMPGLPDIADALHALYPEGAYWSVDQDGNISWMDLNEKPKPEISVVQAKLDELTEIYNREQLYQNQRVSEYPEYHEQLDMLFNLGYDGWKAEIQKIKDKYPKPE
jgi:hypothetical protein